MTRWKAIALAAALAGAAGTGAARAPIADAQEPLRTRSGAPQVVEIFGGSARIGASVRDVEEGDRKEKELTGAYGALVTDVHEDTPAATAGLKSGDVVVEFDGERVRSARQFTRLVRETPSGRKVQAVVIRDGQRVTLTVQPRESTAGGVFDRLRDLEDWSRTWGSDTPRPPTPPPAPGAPPRAPRAPRAPLPPDFDRFFGRSGGRLGVSVNALSEQLAAYFGTKDGVLVTAVRDDSVAAKAGIKAGDVITAFNGSPIDSPAELRRRIRQLDAEGEFTVDVVRDRKPMTIKGKLTGEENRRRTYRSTV